MAGHPVVCNYYDEEENLYELKEMLGERGKDVVGVAFSRSSLIGSTESVWVGNVLVVLCDHADDVDHVDEGAISPRPRTTRTPYGKNTSV